MTAIRGAGFSQGGQTEGSTIIDMSEHNRLLELNLEEQWVHVEAGMTWRQLLEILTPMGFCAAEMQSYANFSIGGSIAISNRKGRRFRSNLAKPN